MNELFVTLYGENKEELTYRLERIFSLEESDQQYCCAVPKDGGEVIFLRCYLNENGDATEVTISDIPNTAEYSRVVAAYQSYAEQAAIDAERENLAELEDYISVTDASGKKVDFILHTIFEDENSHRSYAAVQQVDEDGKVHEEISLYRFIENNGSAALDMIASDMEYDAARDLFLHMIENS